VDECNGMIHIWHHAHGAEPHWWPSEVSKLNGWVLCGRTEHRVLAHMQEIPENGADIAHLHAIHESSLTAGSSMTLVHEPQPSWWHSLLTHRWKSCWSPDGHRAHMRLKHETLLFGRWSLLSMVLDVTQDGPGVCHTPLPRPSH